MRALVSICLTKPIQSATEKGLEWIHEDEVKALQNQGWIIDEDELINLPEA